MHIESHIPATYCFIERNSNQNQPSFRQMSVIEGKVCEIVFDELKEKYDYFASHHRNIYLKYCTKCNEPVFSLPQYTRHLKHKTFLKPNPLYN